MGMRVLLCPAFPMGRGGRELARVLGGHIRWADLEKLPESILVKEEEEEGGRGWGRVTGQLI